MSWQVIPSVLDEMLNDEDDNKSDRVMQAMLKMDKLDITALKQAYIGKSGSVTKPKAKQEEIVREARAMKQSSAAAGRRRQVVALLNSLPEARAVPAGDSHLSLEVRGKRFGWFLHDHHGDGRVALNLKATRGAAQRLATKAPGRFHVPKYVGHHGWVGVWLDSPAPDWDEIKELLEEAYYLSAPKRLANMLQSKTNETEL